MIKAEKYKHGKQRHFIGRYESQFRGVGWKDNDPCGRK